MLRPVRTLTFHVHRQTIFRDLVQCTMNALPQTRRLSCSGQQRIGLWEHLMVCLCNLRSRYSMWKLRCLLGSEFNEFDFMAGVRQAAILMVDAGRLANWRLIHSCCTERGACAIYSLTQSQRNMQCAQLVRFETKHLCKVVPISVKRVFEQGRRYVYANIVIVGLRDMRDFNTLSEQQEMLQQVIKALQKSNVEVSNASTRRHFVLCKFLLTLRKELTDNETESEGWLVDFYRVSGIKLVNYSPVTLKYCIIELLNPACNPQ